MQKNSSEKKVGQIPGQKVGQKGGQRKTKSIKKAFKLLKLKGFVKFIKRRERDSNPRHLSVRRFSRPL